VQQRVMARQQTGTVTQTIGGSVLRGNDRNESSGRHAKCGAIPAMSSALYEEPYEATALITLNRDKKIGIIAVENRRYVLLRCSINNVYGTRLRVVDGSVMEGKSAALCAQTAGVERYAAMSRCYCVMARRTAMLR